MKWNIFIMLNINKNHCYSCSPNSQWYIYMTHDKLGLNIVFNLYLFLIMENQNSKNTSYENRFVLKWLIQMTHTKVLQRKAPTSHATHSAMITNWLLCFLVWLYQWLDYCIRACATLCWCHLVIRAERQTQTIINSHMLGCSHTVI